MRRLSTICAVMLLCWNAVAAGAHAAVLASSFFTSGDEGWRSFSFVDRGNPDFRSVPSGDPAVVFNQSNGNIAGSIERTDPDFGWQYFVAPQPFLGDQSAALGGTLAFQQQRRDVQGLELVKPKPPLVAISDGTTVLVYANEADEPITTAWRDYLVNFAPSGEGWFVDSIDGAAAAPGQLNTVLANLSNLWIVGEWFAGAIAPDNQPDTIALDNVILNGRDRAPEPVPVIGTAWLMLLAAALMLRRKFPLAIKARSSPANC